MNRTQQFADRIREVILHGTWIANTNFKDQLSGLSWREATTKIGSRNTIAALTFHINYYIAGVLPVLKGGSLNIRDKYSFDLPAIDSQKKWEELRDALFENAEKLARAIEEMPEDKLDEAFVNKKYGSFQRNLDGIIEHSYYHLGQVVLIGKMLSEREIKD